jgi:hypothetical protein
MRFFLVTALPAIGFCMSSCGIVFAEPSLAVKQIRKKTVDEVRSNLRDFHKANEEPLSDARRKLGDLAERLFEERKRDEAGEVLEQLKTLEVDVMTEAAKGPPPLPIQPALLVRTNQPFKEIAGKWDAPPDAFWLRVVTEEGIYQEVDRKTGKVVAQGELMPRDDGSFLTKTPGGKTVEVYPLTNRDQLLVVLSDSASKRSWGIYTRQ